MTDILKAELWGSVGENAVKALLHQGSNQTLGDIFNSMTSLKKDAVAVIFGAISSGDDSVDSGTVIDGNQTLGDIYDSMSNIEKDMIDFLAAGIEPEVSHDDFSFMDDILEHHGVKGQKWGVRRENALSRSSGNTPAARSMARAKVSSNSANLGEAHLAALKTNGHRVANAVLGDKTFWKRTGFIVSATGLGVVASAVAPIGIPGSLLADIGRSTVHYSTSDPAVGDALKKAMTPTQAAALGQAVVTGIGATLATAAGVAAVGVNAVNNVGRAATANARINKSYEQLGRHTIDHQSNGSKRVQKLLSASGANITHSELEHHGVKGQKWGVQKADPTGGTSNTSAPPVESHGGSKVTTALVLVAVGARIARAVIAEHYNMSYSDLHDSVNNPDKTWAEQMNETGMRYNPNATLDPSQMRVIPPGK